MVNKVQTAKSSALPPGSKPAPKPTNSINSKSSFWDYLPHSFSLSPSSLEKIINAITGLTTAALTYQKLPHSTTNLKLITAAVSFRVGGITSLISSITVTPTIAGALHTTLNFVDQCIAFTKTTIPTIQSAIEGAAGAVGPAAETTMDIIPGWKDYTKAFGSIAPLDGTASLALGTFAGKAGLSNKHGTLRVLATTLAAAIGYQGPLQALAAGAFLTTAAASSLVSHVGEIDRSSCYAQIGAAGTTAIVASVAAASGSGTGLAIGATASAISGLFLAKAPLLFSWRVVSTITDKAYILSWLSATAVGSAATTIIGATPIGKYVQPAIAMGKAGALLTIGLAAKHVVEDPSSLNKILPENTLEATQRTWKNFKKNPKKTINKLANDSAEFVKKSAEQGFEKAAEDTYTWAKSYFETAKTWVQENGFDLLLKLPLYGVNLASKTFNFAVYAAPKIIYEGFTGLDNTAKAVLAAYYGAIGIAVLLAFKPKVPSDIEFTSASLIPRTIRAISKGTKKTIRAALSKLEPYAPIAKRINASLFPKEPEAIFNAKLQKEINDIAFAIQKAKTHDGFLASLLLEGDPGTGKTMIGKKIAEQSGCHLVKMTGASLVNRIGSSSEKIKRDEKGNIIERNFDGRPQAKKLREILAFGRGQPHWFFWLPNKVWSLWAKKIPTVIFIDEIDLFLKHKKVLEKIDVNRLDLLYTFLAETGELSKDTVIIGTTNCVKDIDKAARSRFETILHIDPPGQEERERILEEHIDAAFPEYKHPERKTVLNKEGIALIAKNTEHLTGRDLTQLTWRLYREKSQLDNKLLTQEIIDETTRSFVARKLEESDNSALKALEPEKPSFFSRFFGNTTVAPKTTSKDLEKVLQRAG